MADPTPADRAAVSRLGQEHPTEDPPWKLTAAEKAAYAVLIREVSRCGIHPDVARTVAAAVRPPIADEVALELGREVLRDGLTSFLHRLVGPENTARLLAPIATETLRAAADRFVAQHPWNGTRYRPEHVAIDLRQYAAELEQEARDG